MFVHLPPLSSPPGSVISHSGWEGHSLVFGGAFLLIAFYHLNEITAIEEFGVWGGGVGNVSHLRGFSSSAPNPIPYLAFYSFKSATVIVLTIRTIWNKECKIVLSINEVHYFHDLLFFYSFRYFLVTSVIMKYDSNITYMKRYRLYFMVIVWSNCMPYVLV